MILLRHKSWVFCAINYRTGCHKSSFNQITLDWIPRINFTLFYFINWFFLLYCHQRHPVGCFTCDEKKTKQLCNKKDIKNCIVWNMCFIRIVVNVWSLSVALNENGKLLNLVETVGWRHLPIKFPALQNLSQWHALWAVVYYIKWNCYLVCVQSFQLLIIHLAKPAWFHFMHHWYFIIEIQLFFIQ